MDVPDQYYYVKAYYMQEYIILTHKFSELYSRLTVYIFIHPFTGTQRSPMINNPNLNSGQQATSIEEMQRKFGTVVSKTFQSLEDQDVSARQLAVTLLALGAYEPVMMKEQSLLEDHEDELYQAHTIPDIYRVIRPYMSFFNPELLQYIIETHGITSTFEDFKVYMNELETFCKSISVPLCLDSAEQQSGDKREEVRIKINLDLSDRRLQRIRDVKSAIAKILHVREAVLYLVSVEEGCAELVFLVPQFIIESEFPLLEEQYRSFCSLGALRLTTIYKGSSYILEFKKTVSISSYYYDSV